MKKKIRMICFIAALTQLTSSRSGLAQDQLAAELSNAYGDAYLDINNFAGLKADQIAAYLNGLGNVYNGTGAQQLGRAAFVKASGEYLKARGVFQLTEADIYYRISQAELTFAQAQLTRANTRFREVERARLQEEVKFWRMMNKRFRGELYRLRDVERDLEKNIERMQKYWDESQAIRVFGTANTRLWRKLNLAFRYLGVSAQQDFYSTILSEESPEGEAGYQISASEFVRNSSSEDPIPSFPDKALEVVALRHLMRFMKAHDLSAAEMGDAHVAILEGFATLETALESRVSQTRNNLIILRDSQLDFWQNIADEIRMESSSGGSFSGTSQFR